MEILARHPGQVVPVARIVEELWPGTTVDSGRTRLHVVASRARQRLPTGTLLEPVGDGYRLAGGTPVAPAVEAIDGRAGQRAEPDRGTAAITRERVLGRLEAAGTVPLIGVTAPTGFGKTVLLRQWAARQGGPVTWIDLGAVGDVEEALDGALGAVLVAATGGRPRGRGPVAVVIDRFERARHVDTGPRLEAVVRRLSPVTVALASREALPIPSSRMEVRGELVKVGPADLALTPDEADLLRAGSGADVVRLTGGWPEGAALLAAASGSERADVRAACAPLLERVLAGLPPDLAAVLAAIGDLDHLTPDLVDAVRGLPGSAPALAALADRHHLLVRRGDGYDHHPLLRRLLEAAGSGEGTARVRHVRAARWHLRQGQVEPALDHAHAAPDLATVRSAFLPAVEAAARRGDAAALLRWSQTIRPPSIPDAQAAATVVWALAPPGRRERWEPGPDAPAGVRLAAAAVAHHADGRCELALAAARDARSHLGGGRRGALSLLEALLLVLEAEEEVLLGATEPGARLREVLDAAPWPWFVMGALGPRALAAELAGRRREALALLDHGRARAGALHPSWALLAPPSWLLTRALADLDRAATATERDRATQDLVELVERCDTTHRPLAVVARHALHLACTRAGDPDAAQRWQDEADAGAADLPPLPFLATARHALTTRASAGAVGTLSAQERQVLGYLSTDMALAEIAEVLFLSPHTVKAHTRSIYRKLHVHNRAAAVVAALHA